MTQSQSHTSQKLYYANMVKNKKKLQGVCPLGQGKSGYRLSIEAPSTLFYGIRFCVVELCYQFRICQFYFALTQSGYL